MFFYYNDHKRDDCSEAKNYLHDLEQSVNHNKDT